MSVWDFSGKRAVIVGCYSGMGEATALALARLHHQERMDQAEVHHQAAMAQAQDHHADLVRQQAAHHAALVEHVTETARRPVRRAAARERTPG